MAKAPSKSPSAKSKRPICTACGLRAAAINRYYGDRVYYRSRCDSCSRKNKKIKPARPRWQSRGYVKKPQCDRCGFRAAYNNQLMVYHIDGDLTNATLSNLRTVCLNCAAEVNRQEFTWKPGDLEPDS